MPTRATTSPDSSSGRRPALARRWWYGSLIASLLLLAAAGWWVARAEAAAVDRALRQGLAAQAHALARTLHAGQIAALSFAPADADSPVYRRLGAQFHTYAAAAGVRCIFTVAVRDGRLVFGPESPLPGDPLASTPGSVYEQPPPGLAEAVAVGRSLVVGPYRDEFGTFVTAFAPVRDRDGRVLCLVAVDAATEDWSDALLAARVRPLVAVLLMALLIVVGLRAVHGGRRPATGRHAEIAAAAGVGLVLAIAIGLSTRDLVQRLQREEASRTATILATRLVDGLAGLRLQVLPGLADCLAGGGEAAVAQFRSRASLLLADPLVQAAWLIEQPAAGGAWRALAAVPATAPAPAAPAFESALLAAQASGLAAAASADGRASSVDPVLVAQPVPGAAGAPPTILALRLQPGLRLAARIEGEEGCAESGVVLRPVGPGLEPGDEGTESRPVFAFGRVWRLDVPLRSPGAGTAAGWMAGLLVGAVAALTTASVGVMVSRRLRLERQVSERTALLEEERNRFRGGELYLRTVLDATGAALWEWDLDAGTMRVDPRGWAMLGGGDPPAGDPAAAWWTRCHPDDRAAADAQVAGYLAGCAVAFDQELRLRHQDGGWRWLRCRGAAAPGAGGRHRRLCGSLVDVTSRREATEQLERQARTQAVLVELATGFVNTPVDRLDGAIEAALAIVGTLSGAERGSLFLYDLQAESMERTHEWCAPGVHPEPGSGQRWPATLVPGMLVAHRRGDPLAVEAAGLPAVDRSRAWLEGEGAGRMATAPLRLGDACIGFVALAGTRPPQLGADAELALLRVLAELFANALARRDRERALVAARRTAESAAAARSAFLANMSHEIRTPMNGVIGMTQLLLDTRLDAEQEDYVRTLLRSGQALLTILNDILDFSRIESGRLQLERIPVDLRQAAHDVAELFRQHCAEAGVDLHLDIEPGLPRRVVGDPARLRQILANLVGNAVKFTTAGHVAVRLASRGSRLSLVVEDTGIGIPSERQSLLFQPFVQADPSTTRQYGGTGLGLSICRRLCELMGGGITLASTPGAGTTVSVDLPLEAAGDDPVPLAAPQALAGRRVLVVERSGRGRAITCDHLAWLGLRPLGVADPAQAEAELLAAAGVDPFALVLVEVVAGETAVAAALRRAAGIARLVALTAAAPRPDAARLAAGGFAGSLTRPFSPEVLARVLVAVLDPARPLDAAPVTPYSVREVFASEPTPLPGVRPGLHVLVVEDQQVNRTLIGHLLTRWKARVEFAEDGAAAVARVAAGTFDLVLMDVQMPILDGLEATRAIRAAEAPGSRRTPIVALTADAMPEDRQRCRDAGMDDHLAKPILDRDLAAVLARWAALPQA